jgi:hypothetical protein
MATSNAKSDWFENKVLTDNLGTSKYLALFTSAPTETTIGTEVTGGGYVRQSISFTITGNSASNTAEVTFPQASANLGTISHWAIMSLATGGNVYYYGATENAGGTNTTFTVNNGDTIKFPIGSVVVTEE